MRSVSLVITSCNRFDLLEQTIASFLKFNRYPIDQYIVIEDSHNVDTLRSTLNKFPDIEFTVLDNPQQLGQMKSIDRAYAAVKSDYIFHCEDDWDFYRSGFIEDSFEVLDSDEKIVTVWLREQNDTNDHPVAPELLTCTNNPDNKYQLMVFNHQRHTNEPWHGFTFNPGLRRLADYKIVAPIAQYSGERTLAEAYYDLGFAAAIFPKGYVRHIGYHRGIRYGVNMANWKKDILVKWRKFKSQILGKNKSC
ncbi:glycosyltransferase family 2 protein [Shewanella sp.]|nr:glycosyltransferase family 2 protein [Shewanella sp.]